MNNKDVVRNVIALSISIAIQKVFSTAVSSADVLMAGTIRQDSLSAVSLAGQVTFVLNLILLGLTIGTSLIVSQYFGKGDVMMIEKIQGYSIRTAFLISFVFSIVTVLFPHIVMKIFTTDILLIEEGAAYLRIVGISYLFMGFVQVAESVMKAVKQVRISTLIGTTALVLNVLFNSIFIFGLVGTPKLGVTGAALGTLLARMIEAVWCFTRMRGNKGISISFDTLFHIDRAVKSQFWHYTLPITLNGLSWGSAFATYSVILGHIGSDMVAANSIATIVRNFALVGCNGIASGSGIYLGALLGRGRLKDAKKDAVVILQLTLLLAIAGGLIVILFGPLIDVTDLADSAKMYLWQMLMINAVYILTKAYNCVFNNGILSAGGDTRFGLICDMIDMWCYSVPLGFVAAFVLRLPPMAVYLLISTDELVKLPIYYLRYRKGIWAKNITEEVS